MKTHESNLIWNIKCKILETKAEAESYNKANNARQKQGDTVRIYTPKKYKVRIIKTK